MCYGIVYTVLYIQNISWPIKKSLAIAVHIYLCWWLRRRVKGRASQDATNHPNNDMKMDQGLKP